MNEKKTFRIDQPKGMANGVVEAPPDVPILVQRLYPGQPGGLTRFAFGEWQYLDWALAGGASGPAVGWETALLQATPNAWSLDRWFWGGDFERANLEFTEGATYLAPAYQFTTEPVSRWGKLGGDAEPQKNTSWSHSWRGPLIDGQGFVVMGLSGLRLIGPGQPWTSFENIAAGTNNVLLSANYTGVGGENLVDGRSYQLIAVAHNKDGVLAWANHVDLGAAGATQGVNYTARFPTYGWVEVFLRDLSNDNVYYIEKHTTPEYANPADYSQVTNSTFGAIYDAMRVGHPWVVLSNHVHKGRRFGLWGHVGKLPNYDHDDILNQLSRQALYWSDPESMTSQGLNYIQLPEDIEDIAVFGGGILCFGLRKVYFVRGDFASTDTRYEELPFTYSFGFKPGVGENYRDYSSGNSKLANVGGNLFVIANSQVNQIGQSGMTPIGIGLPGGTWGEPDWLPVGLAGWTTGNVLYALYQRIWAKAASPGISEVENVLMAYHLTSQYWFKVENLGVSDRHNCQIAGAVEAEGPGGSNFVVVFVNDKVYLYGLLTRSIPYVFVAASSRLVYQTDFQQPRFVKELKDISVRLKSPLATPPVVKIWPDYQGDVPPYQASMADGGNGYYRLVPNCKTGVNFRVEFDFGEMVSASAENNSGQFFDHPDPARVDFPIEMSFRIVRELRS